MRLLTEERTITLANFIALLAYLVKIPMNYAFLIALVELEKGAVAGDGLT